MYIHACIINDDVSFTRNKRVNERIILHYTFQEEVQFPCKISGPLIICFTCFDINMACIIMYCNFFQEVKGLKEKLYAYALARMKTCLNPKFQVPTAMVIEVRFFMKKTKKKKEEDEESVKSCFTCISYLV